MHRYIIKRLLLMIPVIIGVSFLVFFIMDLAPGDAVDILAPEGATAEDLEAIRELTKRLPVYSQILPTKGKTKFTNV